MKFICDTKTLSEICSNVQRTVSTKSSIPAIEGILLLAENGKLTLTGYDLEVGMITEMEARVEEAGSIILNAKLLCDILRSLPGDQVRLEADERLTCRIYSGEAEFSLVGIPAADYPELPSVESGFPIVLESEMLRDMIRKTIFAAAENDVKVVHTGVRFEVTQNHLRLVAVDGFRLAMRNADVQYEGEDKVFVVPKKALGELVKLAVSAESIALDVGRRFIVFEIGSYRIVSRLLEGEFLNYKAAISGKVTGTLRVNTRLLIQSIERTSLLITDRTKSPLRCVFEENQIRISSTTALGTAHDRVPCESEGEHMEIGFNNRYLLDALRVCDADEVLIKIGSPILPILILPTEGEDFLFLVLPVRLRTE